ncbi:MAG: hypothetical protein HC929_24850 [Leptolyngbyaceae cyanobacterium SM2_5_2]|nr:hypothetical protein [Leptolyngbyaceae cyanobacterium SM2_5_2]
MSIAPTLRERVKRNTSLPSMSPPKASRWLPLANVAGCPPLVSRQSLFRMGWDWLKAALENGWPLIHYVCFTHNHDPTPATASRKQHEQRTYRIDKIHTYGYAAD